LLSVFGGCGHQHHIEILAVHELSIAQNIIEIIQQSVPQNERRDVRVVRLKVGVLSGVVADSLDFCFCVIAAGTPLSDARLEIEQIPFAVRCNVCSKSFINDIGIVVCPECGGAETQVLSGRELQVTEIELNNDGVKMS
jgi:hydrogenase nickel incorporation protein HypA/HybF